MNFTEIQNFYVFIGGIISTIGVAYIWLKTTKSTILKDISANKKAVKVNEVDGDKAMVEQMNYLFNQITLMSDIMLKDKIELSQKKNNEIGYIERESRFRVAIELIKLSCENCKITTEKIFKDYQL